MDVATTATGGLGVSDDKFAQAIRSLVAELSAKFPDVGQPEVASLVSAAAQSFADARITEFVPVLIGQQVDRQLRARTSRLAS